MICQTHLLAASAFEFLIPRVPISRGEEINDIFRHTDDKEEGKNKKISNLRFKNPF